MMSPSDFVRYESEIAEVIKWTKTLVIRPDLHAMMVEDGYESSYDATSNAGDAFSDTFRIRVWLETLAAYQI